jgi:hypothetical protein
VSLDGGGGAPRLEHEPLAERWRRLDADTLAEARAAVARGRRFHRLDFVRAPLVFVRTLCGACSFLKGTPGLIEAGMRAIHTFVVHVRIWSLEHDAERGGEPHEDGPH